MSLTTSTISITFSPPFTTDDSNNFHNRNNESSQRNILSILVTSLRIQSFSALPPTTRKYLNTTRKQLRQKAMRPTILQIFTLLILSFEILTSANASTPANLSFYGVWIGAGPDAIITKVSSLPFLLLLTTLKIHWHSHSLRAHWLSLLDLQTRLPPMMSRLSGREWSQLSTMACSRTWSRIRVVDRESGICYPFIAASMFEFLSPFTSIFDHMVW